MTEIRVTTLGASKVVDGVPVWQTNAPVGDETTDVDPLGDSDVMQALGLAAMPYPADASGFGQAIVVQGVEGFVGVVIGARDTRNASIVGKLKPGDVTLHTTGPGSVAQCFLKHEKKQAGFATEDANGKTILFLLDGKNRKGQWSQNGAMIEIGPDGSITFTAKGGASLVLSDKVYVVGELSLPGMLPNMALMQGPPTGSPGGAGALPLFPVQAVGK